MIRPIERTCRFVRAVWNDTSGIILPYAALMLVAFIGVSALAIDTGRQMSLQTQMQAAADALAIAGARELNQRTGAEARATQAIAALVSNGLTGFGSTSSIASATTTFYKSLPAASTGFTGTAATGDADARYVAVTVAPKSVASMFPIFSSNVSAGAQAIAGHTAETACNIAPIFICNPYERSGDTDQLATQHLNEALDPTNSNFNIATLRKLIRFDTSNTSPGHFGLLGAPDGCTGAACLKRWTASDTRQSLSNACFSTAGVKLAPGNAPILVQLQDRFDIYNGNGPSALYSPSINVRKGYVAGGGGNWCNAQAGDYLRAQMLPANAARTVLLAPVTGKSATTTTTTTTTNNNGKGKGSTTTTVATTTLSIPSGTAGIEVGMSIASGGALGNGTLGISAGTTVSSVVDSTTITISNAPSIRTVQTASLDFLWLTADLPLDTAWTGLCSGGTCVQGNGQWDCGSYWAINHAGKVYGGNGVCGTPSTTTASRYDVYKYENSTASFSSTSSPISDYSGYPRGTQANGETGSPKCAIAGGFTPTYDATFDPRIMYAAIINCAAQTALGNISGGNSSTSGTPAAGFAKVFLTQPYNSDLQGNQYGEMTGLVGLTDGVVVLNQVQLYR